MAWTSRKMDRNKSLFRSIFRSWTTQDQPLVIRFIHHLVVYQERIEKRLVIEQQLVLVHIQVKRLLNLGKRLLNLGQILEPKARYGEPFLVGAICVVLQKKRATPVIGLTQNVAFATGINDVVRDGFK